jgi:ribosomal protein L18
MNLRTIRRRRRERRQITNEMGLLKSEKDRIVIRRTNKYFIVQALEVKKAETKSYLV